MLSLTSNTDPDVVNPLMYQWPLVTVLIMIGVAIIVCLMLWLIIYSAVRAALSSYAARHPNHPIG